MLLEIIDDASDSDAKQVEQNQEQDMQKENALEKRSEEEVDEE